MGFLCRRCGVAGVAWIALLPLLRVALFRSGRRVDIGIELEYGNGREEVKWLGVVVVERRARGAVTGRRRAAGGRGHAIATVGEVLLFGVTL
jgi:hypothetical protein